VADTPYQVTGRQVRTEEPPSVSRVLGDGLKRSIAHVQDYSLLCLESVTNILTGPRYLQDLLAQMDAIGVGSLSIVLLAGFFIGAVMVMHTGSQFSRFGQTALTGDIVAVALVRELGPTISGLLVAGRCASGIASELGSMLVTEQVDAMRAMGTDPSRKLVTPRVVATLLMLPLLTAMADFIGLVGGSVVSVFTLRLDAYQFWSRAIAALDFADIGFILSTVGCYQGLNVRGGTQGVGRATTQAVVVSSVLILASDVFLTRLALYLSGKFF